VVTWTEALRTGVAEIDEQHLLLFRRAAVVREAVDEGRGTAEVHASLVFLSDYAAVHFETEARYMQAAAFPMAPAHLAEHVVLAKRLEGAAEAYVEGGESPALAEEVVELFETWLLDHIEVHDRVLAAWLQRTGRARRS
jgi:hemerythrin-like metal-binding protein